MSIIDRQRITAVQKLEDMGYTFSAGEWVPPAEEILPPDFWRGHHAHAVGEACGRAGQLHRGLD